MRPNISDRKTFKEGGRSKVNYKVSSIFSPSEKRTDQIDSNKYDHIKKYDKNIKDIETAKNFASQVSSDLLTVNFKSWEEFYSSQ